MKEDGTECSETSAYKIRTPGNYPGETVPSSRAGRCTCLPMKEDGTECSETSAYKIRTPGNYPGESIQQPVILSAYRCDSCRVRGTKHSCWHTHCFLISSEKSVLPLSIFVYLEFYESVRVFPSQYSHNFTIHLTPPTT